MYLMYNNESKMNSVYNTHLSILQQVDSSIIDWLQVNIWLTQLTNQLTDRLNNWPTNQMYDWTTDWLTG